MYVNAVSGNVAEDSTLILGVVEAILSEDPSGPVEPPVSADAKIDTFEDYADSASLAQAYVRDTTGGTNTVTRVKSTFEDGGQYAMSMTYNTSGPGYSGVVKQVNEDWTGAQSLQMAYLGNGLSGQSILLRIESGEAGNWVQTDLLDLRGFDPYSANIQNIDLALDSFQPLTDGAVLDLSNVLSFGIYVKQLGGDSRSGTLVFDNISWSESLPAEEPPCYEVSFADTAWNASGSDTLMSVLQRNAVITPLEEGLPTNGKAPYILQVRYNSNNAKILKNSGEFSSKGVFRAEGDLGVNILEVTVYADGRQYYVPVGKNVTIHISDLDQPIDVLDYLHALTGNGTLNAMHNKEPNAKPRTSTDRIMETTGITPAVWSGDFLFMKDDVANRQKMIDEAIHQWNDGALINLMFHVPSPLRTVEQEKEGANWSGRNDPEKNCVQCNLTTEEWESLLTDGEPLNVNWKLRLDEYAYYLQQLKDAGVVPMVRPFHEMNQNAFWWANVPQNTAALYRLTKDYLVNEKGLDNMIWIWDLQDFDNRMNWEDYNPGNDYWDILALDVYSGGYSDKYYTQMQQFGEGKLIAIGECWSLIQPSQLASYKDYVFAMPWADDTWNMNSAENIQAFYDNTVNLLQTPTFASRSEGPEQFELVLDDFESYESSAELQAAYPRVRRGGTNTAELIASENPAAPGNAMKFTYTLNNRGYSSATHAIKGYWPDMKGISLWYKGDGAGQDVALQFVSGATYEAHLNAVEGFDAESTDWQYLEIPVESFTPTSGSTAFNPKGVSSFVIYVYAVDGAQLTDSVLAFDEIKVIFDEEPQLPTVTIDQTTMSATGSDNLITTLRKNSTVSFGGRLDLVQYEVDDSGILDAVDELVPKGIFRKEGTVNLTLKKAQIYADGSTFFVDLDQPVTINVVNLDKPVDVLDYFKSVTGKDMITALHNQEPNSDPDKQTSQLVGEIGITPAMWSGDFLYAKSDIDNRQTMIDEAIREWNNGAIIQLMLHVAPPTMTVEEEKNGCAWDDRTSGNQRGVQCYLSAAQWEDLLTDGGELNTNWKLRLDEYAYYLQQLKDAGATVLFRPFHEMNQHVFWWGGELGEYGTTGLYRMTRDYLENEKGLDNIIWVWDMQDLPADYAVENSTHQPLPDSIPPYDATDLQLFNPGEDYWDIFAIDFYDAAGYSDFWYDQACSIVAESGKPMIIGETGTIITEEEWNAQPQWSLCMPWAGQVFSQNSREARLTYYGNHLSVEDTPTFKQYSSKETKYVIDLDDYESYASDDELHATYTRNANGGANSTALVDAGNEQNSGSTAMQFTYTLSSAGYSGVYRSVNGYWPGLEAISLWFKGDAKGQDILLQLSDGASYEAHLNAFEGYDPESTDWQYLEIPIENFTPKTGSGTINLKGITSFAIYVNAVNGAQFEDSVLMMDDVKLIFPEEPAMPKITFNAVEMNASGNDNLITTLRENVSITGNGELVQVQYTVDDSGVLDAVSTLVPKGIFRKEGTVNLTIKKAQVYIDDTTYVLDVNQPVTIHVSDLAEPVDVVDYMLEITGKNLITGMHFDGNYSDADSIHERIANEFGTYPAFYSADFLTGNTVPQRQNMINEVIRQWNNGAIVQIMFHVSPPQFTVEQERQGTWGGDGWNERKNQPNHIYSFLYNADWEELMTDGTPLNTNWKLRMDEYARFLQQLEDAGVTVLLRPFHEMNQHVFWWGGRTGLEGTAGLYRMFHDYMEIEKGLSNIIWVWDVQDMPENYGNAGDAKFAPYRAEGVDQSTVIADYDAQDIDLFNPGADYYDILALDFYDQGLNEPGDTLDHNHVYTQAWYDRACEVAARDGKPMIIGETWAMISPETFAQQPNWTMCMPWGNRTWTHNATGAQGMKEHYQAFLNIEDTPTFSTRNNVRKDSMVVEDYTTYADDAALREAYKANANGDANSVAMIDSPFADGEKAMQFTYNLANSGYSGAARAIEQDWTNGEALNFWFQGDGKGQDILLQVGDGDLYSGTDYTFECHLNDLPAFDKESTEPQYLEIPLSEFKVKSGSRTLDLENIQSFAMYVNAVSGNVAEDSTLTIGVIRLSLNEKPEEPEQPDFEELTAAIAAAEAVDKTKYTSETVTALEEALEAAKAALESDDQAQIDAAVQALNDAIAGLEEKPDDDQIAALWEAVRQAQADADAAQAAAEEALAAAEAAAQSAAADKEAAEKAAQDAQAALDAAKAARDAAKAAEDAAKAADEDAVKQAAAAAADAAKAAESAANAASAQAAAQAAQALAEEAQKAAEEAAANAGEDADAAEAAQKAAEAAQKAADAARQAAEAAQKAAEAADVDATKAAKDAADAAATAAELAKQVAENSAAAKDAAEQAKESELNDEKAIAKAQLLVAAFNAGVDPSEVQDGFDAIDAAEDAAGVRRALEEALESLEVPHDTICPSKSFTDVPGVDNWAHAGIDYCVENELMNGMSETIFSPAGTVTRAQLVTILYRAAGEPETEYKGTFTDVADGRFYSKAIEWAAANEIVNGIGNNLFNPDGEITREQIATILYRYSGAPEVEGDLSEYPDASAVSNYAVNAMLWATAEEIIQGVASNGVTRLEPKANATRAQIATIMMRYLEK